MSPPVRVLVADLYPATHTALLHVADHKQWHIAPVYGRTHDETLTLCYEWQPDILFLSLSLLSPSREDNLQRLTEMFPRTDLVVLADDDQKPSVPELKQAGIIGCFLRSQPVTEWLAGLQAIAAGMACFSQEIWASNERPEPTVTEVGQLYGLTPREGEVFALLLQGLDGRQISETLNVTYQTARNYQSRVYQKLGVNGRAEFGLLDEEESFSLLPDPDLIESQR
ncbi:MAG: response regulator transcription factor [Ardenticatenaceae bacterium]|nr:response regulator transcription factor [Ardenticatenaceae bacterium]